MSNRPLPTLEPDCPRCGEFQYAGHRHKCAPLWLVCDPEFHLIGRWKDADEDCRAESAETIRAPSIGAAVEAYAEHADASSAEYTIANGEACTVYARRSAGADPWVKYTCSATQSITYYAREVPE